MNDKERISKALEVLEQIDHNRRLADFHLHLERISRLHDLLPPEILKAALKSHREHMEHVAHELGDVPALLQFEAA